MSQASRLVPLSEKNVILKRDLVIIHPTRDGAVTKGIVVCRRRGLLTRWGRAALLIPTATTATAG